MIIDAVGPAQFAALAILAQRGLEEIYSQWNTRRLLAQGAHEEGREYYTVVAVTHLAWISAIFFLISPQENASSLLIALYLVLQFARYWIIGTVGRYWTHRIITLPGAPIVGRGPYKFIKHPNYMVSIIETFLLPACFGAYALSGIMGAVWTVVLLYKMRLEDAALAGRRNATGAPGPLFGGLC